MIKILASTFLVILLFTGCTQIGSSKDDAIQPDIKLEINALKSKLIDALYTGNKIQLKNLCNTDFANRHQDLFNQIAEKVPLEIKNVKFVSTETFHQKNFIAGKQTKVQSGNSVHDFSISYLSKTQESFIITGYFDADIYQLNVLAIFAKEKSGWKINYLFLANRSLFKKDVYDYYLSAKEHFKNNHLLDAALDVIKIDNLLYPGEDVWHYTKEKEIKQFCEKIRSVSKKKYIFPATDYSVSTQPMIFAINIEPYNRKKLIPIIEYVTKLNISDSLAILNENKAVHASIGKMFPGIDLNNESIIYRIWETNTLNKPKGTESIYRTFIRNTKQ